MQPLVFEPYLRPQVWGGRRLGELFGKNLPDDGTYGESWEISGHSHHVSLVADGPFAGISLTDVIREHGAEILGTNAPPEKFPLLIKLLDCDKLLSIQVHPDDEIAARLLGDEKGKTESWVVLEVEPEGRIYAGLIDGADESALRAHLASGTLEQCLHSFKPNVGDCLFIKSGTVHAVGGGVVFAEVQQSSDATFRLYDWNRLGSDGKPRQLHIEESLRSIDYSAGPLHPVTPQPLDEAGEVRGFSLVRCKYFNMDRLHVMDFFAHPYTGRFSIVMVLEGTTTLQGADVERTFHRGQTVLIPASCGPLQWKSVTTEPAVLLGVTLPSP